MADFEAGKLAVPEQVRQYANQSVEQAKKAFDEYMSAMQKASEQLEGTQTELQAGAKAVNEKMLALTQENVAATFDLAQRMVNAKDMGEVMRLQTEYVQQRMQAFGEQARSVGETAMKSAGTMGKGGAGGGSKPKSRS